MVKASNLIKKLLPIGLVIGGLLLLSQSKRVNIFRTTQPSITVQPKEVLPVIFDKLVPIPTLEPDSQTLFNRYGQLYTKSVVKKDVTRSLPSYAQAYYGSGQSLEAQKGFQRWLKQNRTFEMVDEFTPIFDDDE